jgi:hypothetical protein
MGTVNSGAGPKARSKILDRDPHNGVHPPVTVYSVLAPCATRTCATGSKACRDPRTV